MLGSLANGSIVVFAAFFCAAAHAKLRCACEAEAAAAWAIIRTIVAANEYPQPLDAVMSFWLSTKVLSLLCAASSSQRSDVTTG